jgi:hypothetical protein
MIRRLLSIAVLTCAIAIAVDVAWAQLPIQADADRMHTKLALIVETGNRPRDEKLPPVRTAVTDREVYAYLKIYGPTFLPPGITDPQISIGDSGRVIGRGIVDLDAVRLARPRDWSDPLNYMTGLIDFAATVVFTSSNGEGSALIESVSLGGILVPLSVMQEFVRYYTTTPETPNGFNLDDPFELPANIQRVLFEPERAIVIQ